MTETIQVKSNMVWKCCVAWISILYMEIYYNSIAIDSIDHFVAPSIKFHYWLCHHTFVCLDSSLILYSEVGKPLSGEKLWQCAWPCSAVEARILQPRSCFRFCMWLAFWQALDLIRDALLWGTSGSSLWVPETGCVSARLSLAASVARLILVTYRTLLVKSS